MSPLVSTDSSASSKVLKYMSSNLFVSSSTALRWRLSPNSPCRDRQRRSSTCGGIPPVWFSANIAALSAMLLSSSSLHPTRRPTMFGEMLFSLDESIGLSIFQWSGWSCSIFFNCFSAWIAYRSTCTSCYGGHETRSFSVSRGGRCSESWSKVRPVMCEANAPKVSSGVSRWMFAMLFLAVFQTCSTGLWSGAYGGR